MHIIWGWKFKKEVKMVLLLMGMDRKILCRHKVVEDNLCPCCTREAESVLHALWSCLAAQDVWGGGTIVFQKSKI